MSGQENQNAESANQIWTCSMHPQIKMDEPGKCPICGMDLIPLISLSSSGDDVDPNEIVMTESAAKLASIQTMVVTKGVPNKTVSLQGKVQADERSIAELTARFGGRIEKLFVNFTGQTVTKGEKLATIYSPALVTAQRELLESLSFKETRPSLYTAAKGKLKLWDLTDEQISAIEEKGEPQVYFDVLSPITGTITVRQVAIGDYIKEGTVLFRVIDLTRVWIMFDAYESDLPWIKLGDKIDFMVQALPGKTFSAKVTYIDPFINGQTRVAKVRVEVSNPKLILKPEMFTAGLLESKIAEASDKIIVPKSSILWTGKRAVVYVKVQNRENPSFLYREVVLGPEAGAFYVISEGLEEGEEIAVNGVFKIDAASQLQGLPSMMNPGGGAGSTPHDMSKMGLDSGSKTMSNEEQQAMSKKAESIKTDPAFKTQLTRVYSSYLIMKDAFVATDAKEVSAAAKEVSKAFKAVDMGLLKGETHRVWMEQLKTLGKSIESIGNLSDIENQRKEFAFFNLTFYKSLKAFGLSNVTAYYQFCPMALDNTGAYWFSDSEEIRNPYFGDVMLECGETKEIIK
ncbi:MAG: efflux RND transporter periplasmic adaptor subunit [Candidatus Aminicenantes bacterium]|nr:efflux RND transporter periplasmic adaptor subunit [Candidatus Aminicenantes bacterium]